MNPFTVDLDTINWESIHSGNSRQEAMNLGAVSLGMTIEFVLPRGLVDSKGRIHRVGKMRLATARDELLTRNDSRSQSLPGYDTLIILAQVITQLGDLEILCPEQLEGLFTQDLAYLRDIYNRLNQQGHLHYSTACPHCQQSVSLNLSFVGESRAIPLTSSIRR